MAAASPVTSTARWIIIAAGILTGLLWGILNLRYFSAPFSLYLQVLTFAFSGVLAFTLTQWRTVTPWLLSLAPLPLLALMVGWEYWNFGATYYPPSRGVLALQAGFWLFLLLPFLQARSDQSAERSSAALINNLWHNGFVVAASGLLVGLLWLLFIFCSKLFGLIGIGFFEALFFDDPFFSPIATVTAFTACVALCRNALKISAIFRRVSTLLAAIILPPLAVMALLFIAFLPFTGLAIIPKSISATAVLLSLALAILVMSAMLHSAEEFAPRYPDWLRKTLVVAQLLTPLFALLAAYALWLRITQYGWTVDRIHAAAVATFTLLWTFGAAWQQRRAWCNVVTPQTNALTATMLAVMALLWLLLHSPLIDPYRITVNDQLARLASGVQKADEQDIWAFSRAGRRGHQALESLRDNPHWLEQPKTQRRMVISQLHSGQPQTAPVLDVATLREKIKLRQGTTPPPESWWQMLVNTSFRVYNCRGENAFCMVWMQDMNNDGNEEILLYNREQNNIDVYAYRAGEWRGIGRVSFNISDELIGTALEQGELGSAAKRWRDLQINGQSYPVQYFSYEID